MLDKLPAFINIWINDGHLTTVSPFLLQINKVTLFKLIQYNIFSFRLYFSIFFRVIDIVMYSTDICLCNPLGMAISKKFNVA